MKATKRGRVICLGSVLALKNALPMGPMGGGVEVVPPRT